MKNCSLNNHNFRYLDLNSIGGTLPESWENLKSLQKL